MGIGERLTRFEDQRLLRGEGRFLDALDADGFAEVAFARSAVAHGRITRIDVAAARAVPGVLGVLTGADLAAAGLLPLNCRRPVDSTDGAPFRQPDRHALALETVRFVGEAVALIAAETREAALDAAELVEIDIDDLPARTDPAQSDDMAFRWEHGDAEKVAAAHAEAAFVSRMRAVNNRIAPAPLEPRGALARYEDGRYALITQSQGVHAIRAAMAATLDVGLDAVRVQTPDVGGSFGMKLVAYPEQAALLAGARLLERPLRWISTRSEAYLSDNAARDHVTEATLALDRDGRFLALSADTIGNMGAYASASAAGCLSIHFMRAFGHVYRLPAHHVSATGVYTHTAPVDVMRGAGKPEACVIVERLIDRAAREHGFDRVALRRKNLIRPEDLPRRTLSGVPIDGGDFPTVLDRALERSDWDGRQARRAEAKGRGRIHGAGLALYMHVTSHPVREETRAWLRPDGRVAVSMGAQNIGQGHETSFAQLVAADWDMAPEAVEIVQGDTDALPPTGAATGGSGSLQVTGLALLDAARSLRARLLERAARELEASRTDVEFADGVFRVVGTDRGLTLATLSQRMSDIERADCAGAAEFEGDAATCPNGAYVAEVEIDPDTGETTLTRFSGADDAGARLNPLLVEGQLHGAIAQGAGQALMERLVYEPEFGQLVTGSFMDYAPPRAADLPSFALTAADVASTTNPLGFKGVAECGCIGAPPAIMNAIADAIGHDRIEMPATPARVWRALQKLESKS